MDDLCSEDRQRVYDKKRLLCSITVAKITFFVINFLFEQINHIRTAVVVHPQLSLNCRLPNRISFDSLTGASAKLKRGKVKGYTVAISV